MSAGRVTSNILMLKIAIYLVVFLLLLTIVHAWPESDSSQQSTSEHTQPDNTFGESTCLSESSRKARKIINDVIVPVLEFYNYELPSKCAFHPDNDILQPFADKGTFTRKNRWKCELCDKVFSTQETLDQHQSRKHTSDIRQNATVCLADLCDILVCNYDIGPQLPVACNEDFMKKRRFYCEKIMHKCFPTGASDVAHQLNELFTSKFCDRLTCVKTVPEEDNEDLLEKHSHKWTVRSVLYSTAGIVIIGSLCVLYIGVCIYRRELKLNNDLRRVSSNKILSIPNFLRTRKIKGY